MVAAIGAAAAVGGAAISASGAKSAAGTQAEGAKYSAEVQKQMYDQTREDYAPYREAGYGGLDKLGFLLGLDSNGYGTSAPVKPVKPIYKAQEEGYWAPGFGEDRQRRWVRTGDGTDKDYDKKMAQYQQDLKEYQTQLAAYNKGVQQKPGGDFGSLLRAFTAADFKKDPGYAFRLNEGIKGLDRSAASRGGLLSGAQLKGINRYSQDFASNEYGNAYNRYNQNQTNQFNRLASIAGIGQTATNQVATAGQNMATGVGNAVMQGANASAAGQIGVGNAISGGLNSYAQYNTLNSLLNNQGNPGNIGNSYGHTLSPWNE